MCFTHKIRRGPFGFLLLPRLTPNAPDRICVVAVVVVHVAVVAVEIPRVVAVV